MSAKRNSLRDPLLIRELVQQRPPKPLALGLDLGTSTGAAFAFFDPRDPQLKLEQLWLGQFDLGSAPYESGAIRFVRLRQMLQEINPSIIFYELVRATPPQTPGKMMSPAQILGRAAPAMELIGAYRATVVTYAEEQDIPCVGLGIGEIKKFATGKGNVDKTAMILAANAQYGAELEVEGYEASGTDNIADAVHCLALGLSQYAKGCTYVQQDERPGAGA
jgi:hypothetical protein